MSFRANWCFGGRRERPGARLVQITDVLGDSHKYGTLNPVKTTLEIPDALFRQAKSAAAEQGIPLRELVTVALAEKLGARSGNDKPWMKSFGKLRGLHAETVRINRIIEEEFGRIEPEDWQ